MPTTTNSTTNNTGLNIKPNMNSREKAQTYAQHYGLELVFLKDKKIDPEVINIIPKKLAIRFKILAYELTNDKPKVVKIAVADPEILRLKAPEVIVSLKKKNLSVRLAITTIDDFESALKNYKQKQLDEESSDNKSKISKKTVSLLGRKIPYEVLSKFPREVAYKYNMIVFEAPKGKNQIKVALTNLDSPKTKDILNFIKDRNHLEIDEYKTNQEDIDYALKLYQHKPTIATEFPERKKAYPTSTSTSEINQSKITENLDKKNENNSQSNNISQVKSIPNNHFTPLPPQIHQVKSNINKNLENPKNKNSSKEITQVKSEELEKVDIDEKQILATSADEEKNLDMLLPKGVKTKEELTQVIKGGIIPKIISAITYFAVYMEASDIHIEPTANDLRLRFRVDGQLQDILNIPLSLHAPAISRIKILAKLKIDEQRIPQDGRIEVRCANKDIDLRISTLPTIHGEKVVERILDKTTGVKTLEDSGFSGDNLKRVLKAISKPYGIVLATGPTGSGKTTTLYAILNKISKADVNVVTLEDPVEYEISGVNQCQIKPKIGFGFAEGLRSILRQDPNIIMVGEIRDTETASMATHAALTGHLVLTTLHTNDAAGALPRLINMGVEPFLITSSINCIIAQRLVRKICSKCKVRVNLPLPLIQGIKQELARTTNPIVNQYRNKELSFYKGKGCEYCNGGYKGRIGIFEVLTVSGRIEDLAVNRQPAHVITNQALREGMIGLKQDGIIKVLEGQTTIEEVIKAVSD